MAKKQVERINEAVAQAVNNGDELVIEYGIEIPPTRKGSCKITAGMKTMKIGGSAVVGSNKTDLFAKAKSAGIKITTRKDKDGIRFWRIS